MVGADRVNMCGASPKGEGAGVESGDTTLESGCVYELGAISL